MNILLTMKVDLIVQKENHCQIKPLAKNLHHFGVNTDLDPIFFWRTIPWDVLGSVHLYITITIPLVRREHIIFQYVGLQSKAHVIHSISL